MSYWYLDGNDGIRFNYAKTPTYVCPLSDAVVFPTPDDAAAGDEPHVRDDVHAAAEALGAGALELAKLIRSAHHRHGGGRARDAGGKLTERCAVCGHHLERLGFRCWVDRPGLEGDEGLVSAQIAQRLGFDAPRTTVRTFYVDTKREAQAWARDEHRAALAAAAEASA